MQLEGSPLVEAQNDKFSGEVVRLFMFVLPLLNQTDCLAC